MQKIEIPNDNLKVLLKITKGAYQKAIKENDNENAYFWKKRNEWIKKMLRDSFRIKK